MPRPRLFRVALAVMASALAAGAIRAEELGQAPSPASSRWPPITGELSGAVRLDALGDALPITWRVTLQPASGGGATSQLALDLSMDGLMLRATATPPNSETDPGTWRLDEGAIDLAAALPLATARLDLAALPSDLVLTGKLKFSGAGTWREGSVAGTVTLRLDDGAASSAQQNWSATGLALALEVALVQNRPAIRTARLAIDTLTVAHLTARQIVAEAASVGGGKLAVRRAEVAVFGGRVALAPFTLDPAQPAVDTSADFLDVALGDLAALAPQALAEATGQLAGRVAVKWSVQLGAAPGQGALHIALGSPASIRLAPTPGFLTDRVPAKLNLLPAALGPLSRWTAVDNPAYDTLRRIERGELALNVETLDVSLFPDGLDGPLSARVNLAARPAEPSSVVDRVEFTVNVAGPLSQVLQAGLKSGASFSLKKSP